MRKDRRNNANKERVIMIASSAFVLTALTMTGVYMQSREQRSRDDGYTIDFTALEDSVEQKDQEIAKNSLGHTGDEAPYLENDLDYMPVEAGSGLVELPDRTKDESKPGESSAPSAEPSPESEAQASAESQQTKQDAEQEEQKEGQEEPGEETISAKTPKEASGEEMVAVQGLHFAESDGLLKPVSGETLIPFSADSSVYFATLDHYKRSYAAVIGAPEGSAVMACASGIVEDIYQDAELGHVLVMNLGDGYRITYGQLRDIQAAVGSYVNRGDTLAAVAAPTKYYFVEGSNLYVKLEANGTPVDPEPLFR